MILCNTMPPSRNLEPLIIEILREKDMTRGEIIQKLRESFKESAARTTVLNCLDRMVDEELVEKRVISRKELGYDGAGRGRVYFSLLINEDTDEHD